MRHLSVNGRPLLRWNLVCSNNGFTYENVYLTSTNTDKRMEGEDVLYINKTGSIIGPHSVELFSVRCLPHPDGMTIKGFLRIEYPSGKVDRVPRRYYATLAVGETGKRAKRSSAKGKKRDTKKEK